MFDQQGRYVIQNYQSRPPFSSFLPGIAGPLGVPVLLQQPGTGGVLLWRE